MHSSLKRYVDQNGNMFSLNAEDAARLGYKLYQESKAHAQVEAEEREFSKKGDK